MPNSSSYTAIVATGQQLFVTQRDQQTQLTLTTTAPGQQQSQSCSFTTGEWRSIPALYCTSSGVVLQICGDQEIWLQLQGQQMQPLNAAPTVVEDDRVALEPAEAPPAMQPMEPMKPMKMGDMEMQPMQMKMGDMEMSMGKPTQAAKFCTQCGQAVELSDRFCAKCGQALSH